MSGRVDPDFDPEAEELDAVAKLLSRSKGRMAVFHYKESGNGFQKWILAIVGAIAVMGVVGVVGMYGRLASVETSLADLKQQDAELKQQIYTLEALIRAKR